MCLVHYIFVVTRLPGDKSYTAQLIGSTWKNQKLKISQSQQQNMPFTRDLASFSCVQPKVDLCDHLLLYVLVCGPLPH